MSRPLIIATRGSALALAQANLVLSRCRERFPQQSFELKIIKTTGDRLQSASLANPELPKGLFTKELEIALLEKEADLAVHSLKDLPTELPAGMSLAAVLERADVRDVLIYRHIEFLAGDTAAAVKGLRRGFKPEVSLRALPHRAVVGTSSTRRMAQINAIRPDIVIVPLRGNVGTRLHRLAEQTELDAIVLAAAGLERLELRFAPGEMISGSDVPPGIAGTRLSYAEMLPCVGQAAIGLEIRTGDDPLLEICAGLNHGPTWSCVTAERAFLAAMGGGCNSAVAALGEVDGAQLRLRAVSFLGKRRRDGEESGESQIAVDIGRQLADRLLK